MIYIYLVFRRRMYCVSINVTVSIFKPLIYEMYVCMYVCMYVAADCEHSL